jgi:stage III sporulation protein AH
MKEQFFCAIHQRKVLVFLAIIGFAAVFVFGYRKAGMINQPKSVTKQEVLPVVVPKEYNANDSLLDLKMERDRERSQEIERIQGLLDKIGVSDEVRKQAEQELWRLTQASSKERELESLLEAKGFKESLVTICQKLVSVVISGKVQPEQAGLIGQVASEVTGFSLDQIQIIQQ